MGRLVLLLGLLLPAGSGAYARMLSVPADYPTIQAAVDAAAPGDTVRIAAGEYEGAIAFKDSITLEGESRERVTAWRRADAGTVLIVQNCPTGTIQGITFESRDPKQKPADDFEYSPVVLVESSGVTLTDCTIQKSRQSGIVISGRPSPTVRKCLVRDNAIFGIYLWQRATGVVEGNTVTGAGLTGIVAENNSTKPLIRGNDSSHNGMHGVMVRLGAAPEIRENTLTHNSDCGIAVFQQESHPFIVGNKLSDNSNADVFLFNETHATIEGNSCTGNAGPGYLGLLLEQERFDELEKYAHRARTTDKRDSSGDWRIRAFYEGLSFGGPNINQASQDKYVPLLEKWLAAFPKSPTPRIALARAHAAYGWEARGTGYAYTVTPEGWKSLHEHMDKACKLLEEAENLPEKDPELYDVWIDAGTPIGLDKKEAGGVVGGILAATGLKEDGISQAEAIFRRGMELEPAYFPLYSARMCSLLPQWYGSPEAIVAMVDKAAEASKKEDGDGLYACLARNVLDMVGAEKYRRDYGFSWERIEKGSQDWLTRYPKADAVRQQFCRLACYHGHPEVAAKLFQEIGDRWSQDVWYDTYYHDTWQAWANGKGAPPGPELAIHEAAREGDTEEAIACLGRGENINARTEYGETPLGLATREHHWDLAKELLRQGADPKEEMCDRSWSPLGRAVWGDDKELVMALVEKGADPNERFYDGHTSLSMAIARSKSELALYLIEHGGDADTIGFNDWPVLVTAVENQLPEVVDKLLEKNPQLELWASDGCTALQHAVHKNDAAAATKLIEKGANVNGLSYAHTTALYQAADRGCDEVLKVLLEHGADPGIPDSEGLTPLAIAEKKEKASTVALLKAHGVTK